VIPIAEIASILNPAPKGRRYLAIYRFFCDESYDANPNAPNAVPMADPNAAYVPATYIVAGFFAEEATWTEIERRWKRENERVGVTRYHAANVNGKTGEFAGWSNEKRDTYSKNLLAILRDQKMGLHAIACGLLVRDYEDILSPAARDRFGPPHLACFKTVVATIAQEMARRNIFQPEDRFAVIFDHTNIEEDREKDSAFLGMKYHPSYIFGGKLATCNPGTWEDFVELQPADLIAYEGFKALHQIHTTGDVRARKSLNSLFSDNGFVSTYLDRRTLSAMKPMIEASDCQSQGFILQFDLQSDRGFGIPLP